MKCVREYTDLIIGLERKRILWDGLDPTFLQKELPNGRRERFMTGILNKLSQSDLAKYVGTGMFFTNTLTKRLRDEFEKIIPKGYRQIPGFF